MSAESIMMVTGPSLVSETIVRLKDARFHTKAGLAEFADGLVEK